MQQEKISADISSTGRVRNFIKILLVKQILTVEWNLAKKLQRSYKCVVTHHFF